MNWFLKKYVLSFVLLSSFAFSQQKEIAQIDTLLDLNQEYAWIDRMKALRYAKQASLISEKINNSEKKAYSYVYMAKTLGFLGLNKESFEYLEKAKNEEHFEKDLILQALVKEENSVNYGKLHLDTEVLKENREIISLLKNEKSPAAARINLRAYGNIAACYMNMDNYKMAVKSMAVVEAYSKEPLLLKSKHIKAAFSNIYANKGYIYLNFYKKRDSALYYFNKSLSIVENETKESKSTPYIALGDYYFDQKNYSEALRYYLKSIDDIEYRKIDILDYKITLYKKIADLYTLLNQPENQKKYLIKYYRENEKNLQRNPANIRKAVSAILDEEENKSIEKSNFLIKTFAVLCIVVILLVMIIYRIRARKRQNIIRGNEQRLSEKRKIIFQKEQETLELKSKLNSSIKELYELAKNNHPNFYRLFLEIHPDFETRLIKISPSIQNSDFVLLAYIYMNFETKEIAEITYKSVRTIQNRKYILRKNLKSLPMRIFMCG